MEQNACGAHYAILPGALCGCTDFSERVETPGFTEGDTRRYDVIVVGAAWYHLTTNGGTPCKAHSRWRSWRTRPIPSSPYSSDVGAHAPSPIVRLSLRSS